MTLSYFLGKLVTADITAIVNNSSGLLRVLKEYQKIVIFLGIPFYALASYLLFRKSGQNYTENLVLNIYMMCGWVTLSLLLVIAMIFTRNVEFLGLINDVLIALIFIYVFIFYYQYFSAFGFKKVSLILRVFFISLLILTIRAQINTGLNEIGLRYFK